MDTEMVNLEGVEDTGCPNTLKNTLKKMNVSGHMLLERNLVPKHRLFALGQLQDGLFVLPIFWTEKCLDY